MRTSQVLSLAAPVLSLTMAWNVPQALAQESLAGVGAAGAMGATLGAAATTNIVPSQVTRNVRGTNATIDEAGDPSGRGGMSSAEGGSGAAAAPAPKVPPPLASVNMNGEALLSQLLSQQPFRPIPEVKPRTPRQQAAYARKMHKMTAAQRKKMIAQQYQFAPVNYLASYLPEDRYKFGRDWKFVSTETDHFYYTPRDMTRHKFNANRVIGFRTWQDAMLAGYRPDPATRPSPGHELAFFASLTRDKPLIDMVEYAYAGQVPPSTIDQSYNYLRQVKAIVDSHPSTRAYAKDAYNSILTAYLVGDPTLIPTQLGYVAPPPAPTTGTSGSEGMSGSSSSMSPSPMAPGAMSNSGSGRGTSG